MSVRFLTKEEIQAVAKGTIGKTFREISNTNLNYNNKGTFGQLIEKSIFNFANNSKSAPDFEYAGIELKLTPYKINNNGTLSAKERLVLNIINFLEEYKYSFENSHFLYKNKNIQLLWYLYEKNKNRKDYIITNELYFSIVDKEFQEDYKIIKADWELIIDKIKKGKAHEISESDTMYLGACPKGKDKTSLREQPFSDIKAMQRAFCYKISYMTLLVRKYIAKEKLEKVIKKSVNNKSFEEYVVSKIKKYYGKTEKELLKLLNVETTAKNKFSILYSRMLKINGDIEETEEFLKANIKIKTIRIEHNGNIKESMSFPAFKFMDIANKTWEESDLYYIFENTKFMFVVFRKNDNNEYVFEKIKLWNMPERVLQEEVKKVWNKTKNIIKNGNILKISKDGKIQSNFPKLSENMYCHVRPHARCASDTYTLPVCDKLTGINKYTKQCFWLNSSYIKSIVTEEL